MSVIQRASIPHALVGRNVIGTAKTGSGKTLAFIVPLVERLYREEWTSESGVGAIVVSPTRELAMQTFEVLKQVCKYHDFQGGLMIGKGMDLAAERRDMSRYSIIVATPGRLLQHLDESSEVNADSLQMIVFDECDRLLDLGFETAVNAILGHLPKIVNGESHQLQCLMFSATNNRVLVGKRVSHAKFVDIDPHRLSKNATPNTLRHFAMNVTLDRKIIMLWSFIKKHLFSKMMIFVTSCKQARYLEEIFRRLQVTPGWIGAIHGRLVQQKRMAKYFEFRGLKSGILIATDIAARGLDFPAVDWVIQMDVPDDAETYIHRVGRTARLGGEGSALMFIMPSEDGFYNKLSQKGIMLDIAEPKEDQLQNPTPQIQALLSADPDLKYLAQKAFTCYMRAVHLAADKEIFDIDKLPYKQFSESLGLITVPKIKFGKSKRADKNLQYALRDKDPAAQGEDAYMLNPTKATQNVSRVDKIISRGNKHRISMRDVVDDDEEDLFVLERGDHGLDEELEEQDAAKKLKVDAVEGRDWDAQAKVYSEKLKAGVKEVDEEDKQTAKSRRKERRRQEKLARKQLMKQKKEHEMDRKRRREMGSDVDEEEFEEEKKEIIPQSVADQERLALQLLEQDF
jgi:ATP-dependent RNA helicase DDX10/DBP4